MHVILRWGILGGIAIAVVDLVAGELSRTVTDAEAMAWIEGVDLAFTVVVTGWLGFRVAKLTGEMRSGLETAVIAGLIAGVAAAIQSAVRTPADATAISMVSNLAWNIVLASAAGALGAWVGGLARPPSARGGPTARR
jgi:hypothetical protein